VKRRLLDSHDPSRRTPTIDLNAALEPYLGLVIVGLVVTVLLLLVLVAVQARRLGRLSRRLSGITRGTDGGSLEAVLDAHLDKVFAVARELDELAARSAVLEGNARRAFQRVGLVRFNPFEDTGGNQSFAIAVLDAGGDGFVLSSLHARGGTRMFAKAVSAGRSEANLSAEEAEALSRALAAPVDRMRSA
jgi:hypothetical protein